MSRVFLKLFSLITFSLLISGLIAQFPVPMASNEGSSSLAFQKGMNYVGWLKDAYELEDSDVSLANLAKTNAGWVALVVTWYQDTATSTNIYPHAQKTPSDSSVIHAINVIHDHGMKVMLKPHVDCLDGTWRGHIAPDDRDVWFSSYQRFINHYADVAQRYGVEQLCVGCELKSVTDSAHTTRWQNVISEVRARYSGPLIYVANWDEYKQIDWWNSLDYIGIDAYFPLTNKNNPSLIELKWNWWNRIKLLESWLAWQDDKRVIFTEIGYCSYDGTNKAPGEYGSEAPLDLQEQANCYEAAFQALWNKSWLHGIYWWAWLPWPNAGGSSDRTHTPQNKPAQTVITSWYAKQYTPEDRLPHSFYATPMGQAIVATIIVTSISTIIAIALLIKKEKSIS